MLEGINGQRCLKAGVQRRPLPTGPRVQVWNATISVALTGCVRERPGAVGVRRLADWPTFQPKNSLAPEGTSPACTARRLLLARPAAGPVRLQATPPGPARARVAVGRLPFAARRGGNRLVKGRKKRGQGSRKEGRVHRGAFTGRRFQPHGVPISVRYGSSLMLDSRPPPLE